MAREIHQDGLRSGGGFGAPEKDEPGKVSTGEGLKGRDKGFAPVFEAPGEVEEYGTIGQPRDSMGVDIRSTEFRLARREGGEVNTLDKVKVAKSGDVM